MSRSVSPAATSAAAPLQAAAPASPRSGGFIAWGIVLIIGGGFLVASALLSVLLAVVEVEQLFQPRSVPAHRYASAPAAATGTFIGDAILLLAGGGLIWTGVACCMCRRWVRPVVMVVAGYAMAYGLLQVIGFALNLPHRLDIAEAAQNHPYSQRFGPPPTQMSVLVVTCIETAVMLGVGVVLPWLMYRYFASQRSAEVLQACDPRPATWLERCPVAVLGWCFLCVSGAAAAMLHIQHPAVPAFITYIVGWPAVVTLCVSAVLLTWGAVLCYRLDRLGWVLTSLLVLAIDVSTVAFFCNGGSPGELEPVDWLNSPPRHSSALVVARQRSLQTPQWLLIANASVEAAMMLGFGAYVSMYFVNARWRIAALRAEPLAATWPDEPLARLKQIRQAPPP